MQEPTKLFDLLEWRRELHPERPVFKFKDMLLLIRICSSQSEANPILPEVCPLLCLILQLDRLKQKDLVS